MLVAAHGTTSHRCHRSLNVLLHVRCSAKQAQAQASLHHLVPENAGAHAGHDEGEEVGRVSDGLDRVQVLRGELVVAGRSTRTHRRARKRRHTSFATIGAFFKKGQRTCEPPSSEDVTDLMLVTATASMYSRNRLLARLAPRPATRSTFTAFTIPETIICSAACRITAPCHGQPSGSPWRGEHGMRTTSPGTQASTKSSVSSHSTVRGMRPASCCASSSSCTLHHTRVQQPVVTQSCCK